MNEEIPYNQLHQYIGKDVLIKNGDKEHIVRLANVKEDSFSIKVKRNDIWDGIEPWYGKPTENSPKFYQIN